MQTQGHLVKATSTVSHPLAQSESVILFITSMRSAAPALHVFLACVAASHVLKLTTAAASGALLHQSAQQLSSCIKLHLTTPAACAGA